MRRSGTAARRVRVLLGLIAAAAVTGCSHYAPAPPPTGPSSAPPQPVVDARSAQASSAAAFPAATDPDQERGYLSDGAGFVLVTVQHRAALDLLGRPKKSTCATVLSNLAQLSPAQAAAAAAGSPDAPTAGLLTQERSAVGLVLTGCLHPDKVSAKQLRQAETDLAAAAGLVDLHLDALGVTR